MHLFKDTVGREWEVTINVTSMKKVRSLLSVDLYRLAEDGFRLLHGLLDDPCLFVDVLFVLCREQAEKRGVSDEDFGRGLCGSPLEKATDAFLEEFVDFFPESKQRPLREAMAKMRAVDEKLMLAATAKIRAFDAEKMAAEILAEAEANTKPPSGEPPAHSE